jgi:hypothetical protein
VVRLAAVVVALACPVLARAEPPPDVVSVLRWDRSAAPVPDETQRLEGVGRRAARAGAAVALEPVERAEGMGGVVARPRVHAFREVEALLIQARRDAATLREPTALVALHRALTLAESHADVPGSAAWLGEIHTSLGVVAAQAGEDGLMRTALRAAATLDPTRGLRAAEANPDLVARYEAIARAVATGPTGSFVVDADAPGAIVHLDDEVVGPAPARLRTPVGRHVIRVTAPGRLGWGQIIDVWEGERPTMKVRLGPTPAVEMAEALMAAVRGRDLDAVVAALADARARGHRWTTWLVALGPSGRDRASVVACDADGCGAPHRIEGTASGRVPLRPEPASTANDWHVVERAWLDPPVQPAEARPWFSRWPTWVVAGVVGAAIVTTALVLRRPDPVTRRETIIDPSGL